MDYSENDLELENDKGLFINIPFKNLINVLNLVMWFRKFFCCCINC